MHIKKSKNPKRKNVIPICRAYLRAKERYSPEFEKRMKEIEALGNLMRSEGHDEDEVQGAVDKMCEKLTRDPHFADIFRGIKRRWTIPRQHER